MTRTKTFKLGEWGLSDKYKITVIEKKDSDKSLVKIKTYGRNERSLSFPVSCDFFTILIDETTPYYLDKIINWIKGE